MAGSGPIAIAERPVPWVFVVGCLRSGTTLLQRLLDHHPMLAVAYDTHFIPPAIRHGPVGVDLELTEELVEKTRSFPRFARLELRPWEVDSAAAASTTYREFVHNLYKAYARRRGKLLAGEKSPGYCRHIPRLAALCPQARFLHLIRDGREVALSIVDWRKGPAKLELFGEEPVGVTALWWKRDVDLGRRDGLALGGRYAELRYERLVVDPETAMRDACAFLDLPFAPEMLEYHVGRTRTEGARSTKAAWLPPTPGLRDWRNDLESRQQALFEALAGDTLAELGYERRFEHFDDEVTRAAERCRQWWREHVESEFARKSQRPRALPTERRQSRNPFLFVVGCPRSGTTLLQRILAGHQQLTMAPETRWIPRRLRKRIGVDEDGRITPQFSDYLYGHRSFGKLELDPAEVDRALESGPIYADAVSAIFDLYARLRGKPLVGERTPGYVQFIPFLHTHWPQARFIHVVRDGRDVCLSALEPERAPRSLGRLATWDEDPVTTTALWWERLVRLGREYAAELPDDRVLEVRYEALVADPEAVCRELCEFLGLPFDEKMLDFNVGRAPTRKGHSVKRARCELTSDLNDWRSRMSAGQLVRFDAAGGDLLEELGYELGTR